MFSNADEIKTVQFVSLPRRDAKAHRVCQGHWWLIDAADSISRALEKSIHEVRVESVVGRPQLRAGGYGFLSTGQHVPRECQDQQADNDANGSKRIHVAPPWGEYRAYLTSDAPGRW